MSAPQDPEDAKLIVLARSARARTRAAQGAAVRDTDGRTYAAATVALPSLQLSALQVAVAMAVCSGALGLEAAAIVGDQGADAAADPLGERRGARCRSVSGDRVRGRRRHGAGLEIPERPAQMRGGQHRARSGADLAQQLGTGLHRRRRIDLVLVGQVGGDELHGVHE